MRSFQPADNLRSRTFIGLLAAQFLAAFNDQAIHASAMFFAINTQTLSEADAISLMPILFYAPWAIFCTLAGYLADRYSKRNSLIAWKFAEVLITLIALAGFWLGTHDNAAGPWLVLSTVFLMGMHSAFFVPAKYGVMPEILQSHLLSRGNGILESLSFLAIILGTVFGGILSHTFRGQEYIIGLVLLGLAILGAGFSLLIQRMPAANPTRAFPPYLYKPLGENIRALFRSRPLAFAVIGIAFFTFIVAFMRATVYMHGEVQQPRWSEAKTSEVVGMVALGIGLGSPLVGFLSGRKVELGLVPVGALGMILATVVASFCLDWVPGLVVCIVLIGFFTGFYIVPLFTLLQHRAPKVSKGDSIATSNLINVTGAIAASLVFFFMDFAARHTGIAPELPQQDNVRSGVLEEDPEYKNGRPFKVVIGSDTVEHVHKTDVLILEGDRRKSYIDPLKADLLRGRLKKGDEVIESTYQRGDVVHHHIRRAGEPMEHRYDKRALPRLLFLSAAGMTLLTLLLLLAQMPDLLERMLLWFRWQGRARLMVHGMHHLPDKGPVLLVTNCADEEACLQILCATDRTTHFLPVAGEKIDWSRLRDQGERALRRRQVVGLSFSCGDNSEGAAQLYEELMKDRSCLVLPVHYNSRPPATGKGPRMVYIFGGQPLPAGSGVEAVREALRQLDVEFQEQLEHGIVATPEVVGVH
jgi:MFS family permease